MEHEYNVSKKVLAKLKRGLEMENADMDRDIDADYRDNLKTELENDKFTQDRIEADHRYKNLEKIIGGKIQVFSLLCFYRINSMFTLNYCSLRNCK